MIPQQLQGQYSFLPLSIPEQSPTHTITEPNSPDLFKQNLHLAHSQVLRVQGLARDVLSKICHAYQIGASPAQTETYMITLKQDLHALVDLLRQTGIGSLPLLPMTSSNTLVEALVGDKLNPDAILRDTSALYERLRRSQESAATVVNLLSPQTSISGTGALGGR